MQRRLPLLCFLVNMRHDGIRCCCRYRLLIPYREELAWVLAYLEKACKNAIGAAAMPRRAASDIIAGRLMPLYTS